LNAVLPGAVVSRAGDSVTVTLARGTPGARRRILALSAPGVLAFGDWEANALLPSGKTVASRLPAQDPAAVTISQGTNGSPPGAIGAGCMTVQQALALTARLGAGQPRATEYLGGLKLRVPTGFVILEATDASAGDLGVYVLRDRPAMLGNAIVNPKPSTDPNTRTATVEFGFTAAGRRGFQALTKAISHRGTEVSGLGETLNQHFAIVLDNKLLTVPFIDYKLYPDGINGDNGADIAGNLTTRSAQDLAILLRYGPLPVQLTTTG
jgi:SecD/SecF fusion protein